MEKIRILLVDDEQEQRELIAGFLERNSFTVSHASSGEEALERYHDSFPPLALVDIKMPGMNGIELVTRLRQINPYIQVVMLTAFGSVESAVDAMKAGAIDYLTKPIEDLEELRLKLLRAAEQNRLIVDHAAMAERLAEVFPDSELVGESDSMKRLREMISLVGPQEATVLITGPSGTGKELVVRALHAVSGRSGNRLVAINCAALPESLLESELFGFERGAFTGADRTKQGRFELADGGTLFLDEIGEMPLLMQVKLLRVLEERTVQRLGSVKDIPVDIRILAATNRSLDIMMKQGTFREDLFYRLNVISMHIPPLVERPDDILPLAELFIGKFTRKIGKQISGLSPEAATALTRYSWPGNVRELENVIERAIVLTSSTSIGRKDLPGLNGPVLTASDSSIRKLSEIERDAILVCLKKMDWNLSASAEKLGIHRNTLRSKIKEYGLIRS